MFNQINFTKTAVFYFTENNEVSTIWGITIVVISVCFSWALGPRSPYFSFSLAVVIVCLSIACAEKAKKIKNQCHQLIIDGDKINTMQAFNSV